MAASLNPIRANSQPRSGVDAAAGMGDSMKVSGSKRKVHRQLSTVARVQDRKRLKTGVGLSGLQLRDGPLGHSFKAWELGRLRFMTSLGLLKYPALGMPPLKPTEDMICKVVRGVLTGIFRDAFLIPAAMLSKLVDPDTATLHLDDEYEFLPEPLFSQDYLDVEERSFSSLYFISMYYRELPSFYFWLPKDMPPPLLRTHYGTVNLGYPESESDAEQTIDVDEDIYLSPPSSQDSGQSSPMSGSEELTGTESDETENSPEEDASIYPGPVRSGGFYGQSDKRDLSPSQRSPSWISQPSMSLQEIMEGKRPVGTFPLFSCNFPPKLVHGKRGAIQIRDFRNFEVWEFAVAKVIGEKQRDGGKGTGLQIPREYLVNLWLNRDGRSQLYCGWKMVPGQKDLLDGIINRLMTFPEMARERCVLRLHRLGDKDSRLFPPPEFANGKTFCLYNPYVGYSWVRIPWEDGDAWATNSRHFVSHLHWLFPKPGSECFTRYAIEITGHGSFVINTERPSEAIPKSLQKTLASVLANATSPREMRAYNKEFRPSLVDSITMVRVARRRAVRSFRETNSRNFFGCFKRLYHVTNADWAIRVHPNNDHWARDEWMFISPETSIADRRNQFNDNICPLFRQYQNLIVSMCPRNIEVHDGADKGRDVKIWTHNWEDHPKGIRIHHSAADLALICKNILGIDPRNDPPGVLILVSRWEGDKEFLRWSPGMSDLEWRREVYYKIDGPDILVYPGNTPKESVYFGTFLDAVNQLDADRNKYPPPREALSDTSGPEAEWEHSIERMELDVLAPESPRRTIEEDIQSSDRFLPSPKIFRVDNASPSREKSPRSGNSKRSSAIPSQPNLLTVHSSGNPKASRPRDDPENMGATPPQAKRVRFS